MANNQWDREVINVRERPLSSDINAAQSQLDRTIRDFLSQFFTARASATSELAGLPNTGFLGDGLKVRQQAVPGLSVQLAPGLGFLYAPGDAVSAVGGIVGLDDLSVYKPLPLLASASINGIPAGPAVGFDRYDIVEVRTNRVVGNPLSRDTLDTISGLFVSGLVNKTMSFTLDGSIGLVTSPALSTSAISYKVGVVAVTGGAVEPSVTPGYTKIATIFSNNGNMTTSITRGNIIDRRVLLHPGGMMVWTADASIPSGAGNPPIAYRSSLPAGVEFVVQKIGALDRTRVRFWVIGGEFGTQPSKVGMMQGHLLQSPSATAFSTVNANGTFFGTLNATQVGELANAATTTPALAFAVGTPYMYTEFWLINQNGGVTSTTGIPDPVIVDVQGILQRY